ncbi:hypothetical protein [Alkalihalobacillus pseudalcaliphilus]|uniref:hypothetical protein n=1 Tax=Alkalihalobacillus pseudalcaliphilus TaxID=79884 RepID=UPI00064D83F0|nr:hypothetical protein [Alkalihalobacillus pseudalcaliphilus]KMK76561.1 hypothetical protein AB990_15440 [Alkalihalobacillus pseudalcaliphilus]
MAKAKAKKKVQAKPSVQEKYQYTMRAVTSDVCISCKTQCQRGINYMNKMSEPGAIGKGVPCHLTKGKGTK